ncbi:hypothetical protein AAHC03_05378 [Spirometra sp. Aus1]
MADTCTHPCSHHEKPQPMEEPPEVFLIRTTSGQFKWPPLNVYQSFEDDCREFNVIGLEGQLSAGVVNENLEYVLAKRVHDHDQDAFQLGQIMFEKHNYKRAFEYFKIAADKYRDPRARYQIAVMIFDNLMDKSDRVVYTNPEVTAVNMMEGLLSLDIGPNSEVGNEEIVNSAAYNLYLAYLHGWGVRQSDETALKFLLKAAGTGATRIAVLAQTTLGYFYSSPDHLDLGRAFYWHNEACGFGSIESQAVLGLMYMYGLHVKADWCAALKCLKESAERGSVYGKGVLSLLYFQRKMYSLAAQTACS